MRQAKVRKEENAIQITDISFRRIRRVLRVWNCVMFLMILTISTVRSFHDVTRVTESLDEILLEIYLALQKEGRNFCPVSLHSDFSYQNCSASSSHVQSNETATPLMSNIVRWHSRRGTFVPPYKCE